MTDEAIEAVAAYFHNARAQKKREPNPVAQAILERARKQGVLVDYPAKKG